MVGGGRVHAHDAWCLAVRGTGADLGAGDHAWYLPGGSATRVVGVAGGIEASRQQPTQQCHRRPANCPASILVSLSRCRRFAVLGGGEASSARNSVPSSARGPLGQLGWGGPARVPILPRARQRRRRDPRPMSSPQTVPFGAAGQIPRTSRVPRRSPCQAVAISTPTPPAPAILLGRVTVVGEAAVVHGRASVMPGRSGVLASFRCR